MDSQNYIKHKCPCCGYEVEFNYDREPGTSVFKKGDESFIKIQNGAWKYGVFETDKPREVDYGEPAYEKIVLLGCPKCGCVSYQFW